MFSKFVSIRSKVVVVTAVLSATSTAVALCSPERSRDPNNQKIVIVGGGTAGVGVAAMLRKSGMKNVTVIDPSDRHYYQPLWTLVGAGIKESASSVMDMKDCIPSGVTWVKQAVADFKPEENAVTLRDGSSVQYDYLVVAAGIQVDWDKIPGLKEGLEQADSGVVSIYDYRHAEKTFRAFSQLKTSAQRMLFTMSPTLIKCAGAPQKIMWLLEDALRSESLRDRVRVEFWTPGAAMFGVKHYSDQLETLRKERGVEGHFRQQLMAIDVSKKEAVFKNLDSGEETREAFDLLHVCPPMSAPQFIRDSSLADAAGWVDVDKHTLQSTKYSNVFGLGDCTNTPNSKTAAAVTAQAPVLVHNLRRLVAHDLSPAADTTPADLNGHYTGYASCPLIVAKNRVILAEFGYGGKLMESFSHETGKFPMRLLGQDGALQQRFFYWLKEQFFPLAYWQMWIRGYWYGTNGPFPPDVTKKD